MPEEPISKPIEEEEEVLDLDELEREWEEEQRRKQEQRQYINGVHETIEIDVIDVAVTGSAALLELYTSTGDVYVTQLDDTAREIMKMIEDGKVVHVKAVRIKGYKRLQEIVEITETKKVRGNKSRVVKGVLDMIGRTLRVTGKDIRYYINEGTLNYEKLADIASRAAPLDVILLASQMQHRHGQRGSYYVVRGIYIVKPKREEIVYQGEEEELDTEVRSSDSGNDVFDADTVEV